MKNGGFQRMLIIVASFALALGIEYAWAGREAFEAFGLILAGFFMAPIALLAIYLDQKFLNKKK